MSSESSKSPQDAWRTLFDQFRVEVDPNDIDATFKELQDKIRQVANEGRYTKVRISYRGAPLCPDIPIGVLVAAEMAGLVFLGPLRAIMMTLNANALLDIELIHESSEKTKEGKEHYANGDLELAEQCFQEAIEMRLMDIEAHFHLGVLYRVQGKEGEARGHFQQVIDSQHPKWTAKAQSILDKMNGVIPTPASTPSTPLTDETQDVVETSTSDGSSDSSAEST